MVDFSELGEHLPSDSSVLIFTSTILSRITLSGNFTAMRIQASLVHLNELFDALVGEWKRTATLT